MKVLWTVNILFPEAKALLEHKEAELSSSGGWLIGAAEALASREDIELHVACPAAVPSLTTLQGKRICYHLFPGLQPGGEPLWGYCPELDSVFRSLIPQIQPDVIDIHGTEYAHSLSCLLSAGNIPHVITLQGFVHACADHYLDGLDWWTILTHKRPFHHGILTEKRMFSRRAIVEKDLLGMGRCYIGRTEWDRSTVCSLNPGARYYNCQETLRNAFYEGKWKWEQCQKHSLFLSQGSYPLKGLHQVLKALPAVLSQYPDSRLYIGGGNLLSGQKKHLGNYARIIDAMIRNLRLEDRVVFTGNLDTEEMKAQFLRTHVFVCPSSIENSPNSLGEAQLLGVPCVAARVGGIPSMVPDETCGLLYPYEDTAALSECICRLFAQEDSFDNAPMREMALPRHDPARNCETLAQIYQDILKKDS